jgi:NADH:ubiquinone oxidoreductase subunit F (NADH-binding)
MRARAGYIYIRGEFVNERKAVMRAVGGWLGAGAAGGNDNASVCSRLCSSLRSYACWW